MFAANRGTRVGECFAAHHVAKRQLTAGGERSDPVVNLGGTERQHATRNVCCKAQGVECVAGCVRACQRQTTDSDGATNLCTGPIKRGAGRAR